MSEPAAISSGIAERYATAIFQIAEADKKLKPLETGVEALGAALAESQDLQDLIASPVYSRSAQAGAIMAVAKALKLPTALENGLGLMASKRRLFAVPQLLAHLSTMIADAKGEATAEVVSAKALTKAQADKLAATLKKSVGKDIKLNATVDKDLIGGLVVKVGSKMIDTSIRSQLNSLQNAMKEVG